MCDQRRPACGANMLCGAQNQQNTNGNKLCSRILFVVLLGLAAVLGLGLKYFAKNLVLDLQWFQWGCIDEKLNLGSDVTLVCGGNQAVYRVCLGAGAFFFAMMLVAPAVPCFHNGCWLAKFGIFLGLVVACFFIPNEFFVGYYITAVVMSCIFLILQVMLLIDFAYRTHQCIVAKFPEEEGGGEGSGGCNLWMPFYLGYCIVCIVITIGLIIGMFVVFSCGASYGITALAVAVAAIVIALSLVERFGCGFLPGTNVAMYIVWLTWSAQSSNPDRECNPHFSTIRLNDVTGVALGFVITFVSVAWMSMSMHRGILRLCNKQDTAEDDDEDDDKQQKAQARLDNQLAGEELSDISKDKPDKDKAKSASAPPTSCAERLSIFVFHLSLFTASFYVAMICTYWVNALDAAEMSHYQVVTGNSTEVVYLTGSYEAMGAKFGAAGVSFALFLWTLLTPLCCDVDGDNSE